MPSDRIQIARAAPRPTDTSLIEGERLMTICNSCRYCEGYCAVFPAMEHRLNFAKADLNYLANLCHNCAECYYACQYAPPHEFAVNVPQVLAQIRLQSYKKYAWPQIFGVNPAWPVLTGLTVIGLAVMFLSTAGRHAPDANFYAVIPHAVLVWLFGSLALLAFLIQLAGVLRFWRESDEGFGDLLHSIALIQTLRDVLSLKNLSSNGAGCTYPDEHHSDARRRFHHFTFYGFALCFASTSVAAIYDFTGSPAPYAYFSVPVILGTLGGLGLLIGPIGLYLLKQHRDSAIVDVNQDGLDLAFLAMLFLTSLTGLLLLLLRETRGMGVVLTVHLAFVFGLFVTLPYGKFVHGIYRSAALLRSALETARSKH
jgi:citrate/tricarballylate utilization protein